MVKSREKVLARQEKASTSNIILVAIPRGSAVRVSTNIIP